MDICVRPARPEDAAAVGTLTADVYISAGYADTHASPGYVADLADGVGRVRRGAVWVAVTRDGRVVGTAMFLAEGSPDAHLAGPGELEIRMLAVAPELRRSGVGRALVEAANAHAARTGRHTVVLSTGTTMYPAHRLYESLGYRRSPQRDWSYGDEQLLTYTKELAPPPEPGGP